MIISRKIRKARKFYTCDCGKRIVPGQLYARLYGYAEKPDPPYAIQVCMICDERAEKAGAYRRTRMTAPESYLEPLPAGGGALRGGKGDA